MDSWPGLVAVLLRKGHLPPIMVMATGQKTGRRPEINISKIPVGGGVAGLMIALIVIVVALIGIPATRLFLLGSAVLGVTVGSFLRGVPTPGAKRQIGTGCGASFSKAHFSWKLVC